MKNSDILVVKPIPDIILVDFTEKKVYAVECSETTQERQKIPKYSKSDFKRVVFVKGSRRYPNRVPKVTYILEIE